MGKFAELPIHLIKEDPNLMRYLKNRDLIISSLFDIEEILDKIDKNLLDQLIKDITHKFNSLKAPHRSSVPIPNKIQNIVFNYLKKQINKTMENIFSKNLTNIFSSNISDLISFGQKKSSITIENNVIKLSIVITQNNKITVDFELLDIEKIFNTMKKPLKKILKV